MGQHVQLGVACCSISMRKEYMSEKKEDIHKTSVKGVGEPNPPRKQGETEEGKPIEEPRSEACHPSKDRA